MLRRFRRLRETQRGLLLYHLMLRAAVLCLMGWKLLKQQWGHAGLCALTLALFEIPALAELVSLRFPPLLEVVVTLFAACANLGGEMMELYLRFPWWDAGLHLLWGFLAGIAGFGFLRMAQKQELTPAAAALGALGFAAFTSICWESFEYFMDVVFCMDMQKSQWISAVSSILLNPAGTNSTVTVEAEAVLVNGERWPGLLDIGLRDTMSDLTLNFIGSLPAALIAARKGRSGVCRQILNRLAPTRAAEEEAEHEKN